MEKKSRILILSTAYLPYIGGSELAIKNITDRINDFEFDLITGKLDKNSLEEEVIGNVRIFRVGRFFSLFNFFLPKVFLPQAVFFKARSLLKKKEHKLIHAFQLSGAAGAGWLLKFFYPKLPFLITLQEGKRLDKQGILINFFRKLIIKKADAATAISQYLKNYILGARKNINVEVIPNGVDLKNFSRQFSYGEFTDLEDSLDIKPDDKIIVSVSRLVSKNGLDLLVEAFSKLMTNDPLCQSSSEASQRPTTTYKLLIIGDGPLKESLKFKVKSLKLQNNVIFVGLISHGDLPIYLKIADVFVRPARSEGLGSAFLEAMAAGIPVIATKVGGIPDFLEDRKTGLFCSLDPADIASKINIVFENDILRKELIENGRKLVEEKYDWDKIAEQYKAVFKNLNI